MIKEEKNVQIANYEKWPDSPITMVNRHTGRNVHFNSTTSQLFEALLLSHALRLWQWNCILCFSIISDKIIGENGWQSETSVFLSQIQCHFSTISDQFWGGRVKLAGPLRLYFCLKSKVEMGCKVKLASTLRSCFCSRSGVNAIARHLFHFSPRGKVASPAVMFHN